jgi:ribosomal-protein-alanine N-acetyltransferase
VELGCALEKTYWGKGYATEACQPMIEYAFRELKLKRLVNHVDSDNTRAINLMKRLGFRIEKNLHPNYGGFVGILENN